MLCFIFSAVIPQLNGALNVLASINNVTVSWESAEQPPIGYVLLMDCKLLANNTFLSQMSFNLPMTSTSVVVTDVIPGTDCNISLYAEYCLAKSNRLVAMVTIPSEPSKYNLAMHC